MTGARSPFIVSRAYDWAWFLAPPLGALLLGILVARSPEARAPFVLAGADTTRAGFALGVVVHAHLVAVAFRSHANLRVFRAHRLRFVLVPLALFAVLVVSEWVAAAALVLATFWDVYHSGAQTFGFARLYDRNAGAAPHEGRALDLVLNQVLYAGPVLAGVTLPAHLEEFSAFGDIDHPLAAVLSNVPARVLAQHVYITRTVLVVGTLFVAYYVLAYARRARAGHPVSKQKVFLLASTGLCSLYTWTLDSWGEAFLVMNVFHAVQYLALVWATERPNLERRLFGNGTPRLAATALLYFGSVFAYGLAVELSDPSIHAFWALTMVVSLMHFWYDGFVWSVRAGAV